MRAVLGWPLLLTARASEPSPTSARETQPEPAAPRVSAAAAAAERALAWEAEEAARTAAQAPAADAAPEADTVQVLRGSGTSAAARGSAGGTSFYDGARWLQGWADGRGLEVVVF